ncbi:MAG: hypothetical protein IJD59_07295 [Clostridia bacterium]|nr:hypothetical protein [Clostridia bacterium]
MAEPNLTKDERAETAMEKGAEKEIDAAFNGEQMFPSTVFSEELQAAESVAAIADRLLARVAALAEDAEVDTQGVKQLASVLQNLLEIKVYRSELALRRAKLRKLERELEAEADTATVEVVFHAGEEDWNE